MEGITLNTIPTWVPGVIMLYTAGIWLVTKNHQIRMDSRVIAYTLIGWAILYLLASFGPDTAQTKAELIGRVFMSRIVIIFICLSQSLPMTISYVRGLLRERRLKNGTK